MKLHNSKKSPLVRDACRRCFSDTMIPLSIPVFVVQVGGYRPVFRLPFDFCF